MDISGFNWTLITVIGAIALGVIIAVAKLRNRTARASEQDTEAATRRVYEEEEEEHRGEGDYVP